MVTVDAFGVPEGDETRAVSLTFTVAEWSVIVCSLSQSVAAVCTGVDEDTHQFLTAALQAYCTDGFPDDGHHVMALMAERIVYGIAP